MAIGDKCPKCGRLAGFGPGECPLPDNPYCQIEALSGAARAKENERHRGLVAAAKVAMFRLNDLAKASGSVGDAFIRDAIGTELARLAEGTIVRTAAGARCSGCGETKLRPGVVPENRDWECGTLETPTQRYESPTCKDRQLVALRADVARLTRERDKANIETEEAHEAWCESVGPVYSELTGKPLDCSPGETTEETIRAIVGRIGEAVSTAVARRDAALAPPTAAGTTGTCSCDGAFRCSRCKACLKCGECRCPTAAGAVKEE